MGNSNRNLIKDILPWVAVVAAAELYLKRDSVMPVLREKISKKPRIKSLGFINPSSAKESHDVIKNILVSAISGYLKDKYGTEPQSADISSLKDKLFSKISQYIPSLLENCLPTDIYIDGNDIVYVIELPGYKKDMIDIQANEEFMVITAKPEINEKITEEDWIQRERATEEIRREYEFPYPVIPDKAEAFLKDGILTLRFPKAESAITKSIEISG